MALGGRTVTAPDGSTWHVGRQWLPWKLKRRGPDADIGNWDISDAGGADDSSASSSPSSSGSS